MRTTVFLAVPAGTICRSVLTRRNWPGEAALLATRFPLAAALLSELSLLSHHSITGVCPEPLLGDPRMGGREGAGRVVQGGV